MIGVNCWSGTSSCPNLSQIVDDHFVEERLVAVLQRHEEDVLRDVVGAAEMHVAVRARHLLVDGENTWGNKSTQAQAILLAMRESRALRLRRRGRSFGWKSDVCVPVCVRFCVRLCMRLCECVVEKPQPCWWWGRG